MPMQLFSLHATVNPSFSLTSFFPSFLFFAVLILLQFFVIYPDQHRIHNFVISCELFQVCRNSFDAVLNDAQKVLYSSLFSCTYGSDNGLSHFLKHCGSCVLLLVTFLKFKIFLFFKIFKIFLFLKQKQVSSTLTVLCSFVNYSAMRFVYCKTLSGRIYKLKSNNGDLY